MNALNKVLIISLIRKEKERGESIGSYRKKRFRRMRYLLPNSLSQVALSG